MRVLVEDPVQARPQTGTQGLGPAWLPALGIVLIMAADAVSFRHLHTLPVFDDEAIMVWAAHMAAHPHHLADLFGSFTYSAPPLFTWLAALTSYVVSDPLVAARGASVTCGVASLGVVYLLGRRLYGDPVAGLLAALLCAFCPYEFMYDRMALLDPLVQLIGLLIALHCVRLFQHAETSTRQAILLGVLLGLGQLAKGISTFFWLLPILAWFVYAPGRPFARLWRTMLIAAPVAACLYAIILASGNVRNLFRPFFTAIKYSVATPYPGYYANHPHASLLATASHNLQQWLSWQDAYIGYPLLLALLAGFVVAATRRAQPDVFVALWLALPLVAMLFVKIYTSRYVLFTVPIELLLATRGLLAMGGYAQGLWKATGRPIAVAMLVLLVTGVLTYTAGFNVTRDTALFRDPARATLVPDDRWQYIAGWPAGYGLDALVARIIAQAGTRPITVIAAPAHQPIDALRYMLEDKPGVRIQPATLTQRLTMRGITGPAVLTVAVLDLGKDDVQTFQSVNPGWTVVTRTLKPDGISEFVLLAHDDGHHGPGCPWHALCRRS